MDTSASPIGDQPLRPVPAVPAPTAPQPGEGQQLHDVSTAGINFADTHHDLS